MTTPGVLMGWKRERLPKQPVSSSNGSFGQPAILASKLETPQGYLCEPEINPEKKELRLDWLPTDRLILVRSK